MFDKIRNYFKGSAYQKYETQIFPVGRGFRVNVDANGNMVYATCVEILAKNLAQMRWGLYGPDNSELNTILPLYRKALNLQPYPGINAYDFWNYMEKQRQGGNAYAYLKFENGELKHMVPLDNLYMKVFWDDANILEGKRKIVYQYTDAMTQQNFVFLPEEVLHLKAYSVNGIVGRPAINVLFDTLKADGEVESALRSGVANGYDGTIVLSYTSDLSDAKQRELQNRVKDLLGNSNNTILPLPAGMTATNIKNDIKATSDSLKSYNAQAISSFFGIPLAMLNIGGGAGMATFSTNQLMSFYSGTIAPIVKQYADELTVKLLTGRQISKGYYFDTSNDVFDMLDAQTKATVLCAYKGAGILSANEARASLQYPAKDGGDELITVGTGGTLGDNAGRNGGGDTSEEG